MPTSSPLQLRNQIGDFQLGAVEAGGLQVLGQHAARYVQGDHHLHATLLDKLDIAAPLGPGQGEYEQGDAHEPQNHPQDAHSGSCRQAQPLHQGRVADTPQRCSATPQAPPREQHQRGKRDKQEQELGRSEGHISLRQPPEHGLGEDQFRQQQRQRGEHKPRQNLFIAG